MEELQWTVQKMDSQRKRGKISKSKAGGWGGLVGEKGRRKGPEMQSTLVSFTEQATLTHREGDYSEGKAG